MKLQVRNCLALLAISVLTSQGFAETTSPTTNINRAAKTLPLAARTQALEEAAATLPLCNLPPINSQGYLVTTADAAEVCSYIPCTSASQKYFKVKSITEGRCISVQLVTPPSPEKQTVMSQGYWACNKDPSIPNGLVWDFHSKDECPPN